MSSDLRLIVNTTKSHAYVFTSKSPCDRLSKTGLTYARRAIETQNRRLHVTLKLKNCKILDDSFLNLIETIMILVKNLLSILQVKVIIRNLSPRKVQHELDIVILNAIVRRTWIVSLKLSHLLFEDFLHSSWPKFLLGTRTKLGKLLHVIHSKFFLNSLELVIEEVLSLLLINLRLYLLVDFLLDFLQFHLSIKDRQKLHCTRSKVAVLKKLHLIHIVLHLNSRSYEVYQELKIINSLKRRSSLTRHKCRALNDQSSLFLQALCNHSDLCILLRHNIINVTYAA